VPVRQGRRTQLEIMAPQFAVSATTSLCVYHQAPSALTNVAESSADAVVASATPSSSATEAIARAHAAIPADEMFDLSVVVVVVLVVVTVAIDACQVEVVGEALEFHPATQSRQSRSRSPPALSARCSMRAASVAMREDRRGVRAIRLQLEIVRAVLPVHGLGLDGWV
jgi:hypothetical protein